jgi:asparagine synthase (glutamine-hydrolysing)
VTALAGFWGYSAAADPVGRCAAMLEAQRRYGPDDSATSLIGGLALGRRLYRTVDEDRHDQQPLLAGNGRFALVADIRLDNREELAAALGSDGRPAREQADSDLLFLALMRWGEGALDRLLGDFAFAFFDAAANRLMLARDPLGQRPLFWRRGAGFIAFSSMSVGIDALGDTPLAADADSVARYLALLPAAAGHSFHRDISRVDPGHVVTLSPEATASRRWWTLGRRELRLRHFDDYVDAYRSELDAAVKRRLRGAGGLVAAHLSGGWDSGAVCATAARLLAAGGGRVLAFTSVPRRGAEVPPPGNRFVDEGPIAAAAAALYPNIEHVLVENSRRSPIADLDRYAALFQRPVFNLCNQVWLADVRATARERGARVLLTGEIGNWTISAAPVTLLADYLRLGRLGDWAREAWAMARSGRARLRGVAASSFGPWLPDFVWKRVGAFSSATDMAAGSALHPALRETYADEQPGLRLGLAKPPKDHFLDARDALYAMDFGEHRKGILGGWGLDKRDPTADRRLIEFCLSLPIDLLMKNGVRRPLARQALSDRLPPAVLDREGKGYQAPDWYEGLASDRAGIFRLLEEIAADRTAASLVDVESLRDRVRNWPASGWHESRTIARYRNALLQGLTAGHFVLAASGRTG